MAQAYLLDARASLCEMSTGFRLTTLNFDSCCVLFRERLTTGRTFLLVGDLMYDDNFKFILVLLLVLPVAALTVRQLQVPNGSHGPSRTVPQVDPSQDWPIMI